MGSDVRDMAYRPSEDPGLEMGMMPGKSKHLTASGRNSDDRELTLEEILNKPEPTKEDRDKVDLMRLGKIPILKREFGFMSILGFSSSIMVTWESMLGLYDLGYINGGPAGIIFGFLFVWAGVTSVYTCLAELASMAPTSGGQYFWVSMMAPTVCQKSLSYICGWFSMAGWQCAVASVAFLAAQLVQGLIVLTNPGFQPERWHLTLLLWAMLAFAVSINITTRKLLPAFEGYILLLHVLGFFAVLIPILVLGEYREPREVFGVFLNKGGYQTKGLSFMIGVLGPAFGFAGIDGAVHMAEEINNALVVVPRSILFSVLLNGLFGFSILLAMTFTLGDIEAAMKTKNGYAFMALLEQTSGSIAGAAFLSSIVVMMQISTAVAALAAGSRLLWSFARDRGVPGWKYFQKVDPDSSLPIISVITTIVISVLLSFVNLGSSDVFGDVVSLAVAGVNGSYLLAIALLLWRRMTGGVTTLGQASESGVIVNSSGKQLIWGPWRVPGYWGVANNMFAVGFSVTIFFFSFWPRTLPVTLQNMNWSSLVFCSITLFAAVYYFVRGRHQYAGPVVELGSR